MYQGNKVEKADIFLMWNPLKIVKQKLFWVLLLTLIWDSYIKGELQMTSWKITLKKVSYNELQKLLPYIDL